MEHGHILRIRLLPFLPHDGAVRCTLRGTLWCHPRLRSARRLGPRLDSGVATSRYSCLGHRLSIVPSLGSARPAEPLWVRASTRPYHLPRHDGGHYQRTALHKHVLPRLRRRLPRRRPRIRAPALPLGYGLRRLRTTWWTAASADAARSGDDACCADGACWDAESGWRKTGRFAGSSGGQFGSGKCRTGRCGTG